MAAPEPSLSKHFRSNTRSTSKQHITKKQLCQLRLVFPQEIINVDSVKLLCPGIKQVIKFNSGNPKFKLNTQCFVEFENKTLVDKAYKILQRKKVEGGRLIVHRVKPLKELTKQSSLRSTIGKRKISHTHKLTIKHLPENVKDEDIKEAFSDCSRIKVASRKRQATFHVPTTKSLESYLARPIHTVKGEVVELISNTHPPRMSKSHPRKNPYKRARQLERMESDDLDPDKMEVSSDLGEETQSLESPSVVVEEVF